MCWESGIQRGFDMVREKWMFCKCKLGNREYYWIAAKYSKWGLLT